MSDEMKTGQKWSDDEDRDLLISFKENKTSTEIGEHFKRSIGSVQNRIMALLFQMINEDLSNIEPVCQEHNISVKEMERYIDRRDKRRDNRREARKSKNQTTPNTTTTNNTSESSNTSSPDVVILLREIRNYMKIIIDKLDK